MVLTLNVVTFANRKARGKLAFWLELLAMAQRGGPSGGAISVNGNDASEVAGRLSAPPDGKTAPGASDHAHEPSSDTQSVEHEVLPKFSIAMGDREKCIGMAAAQ